MIPQRCGPFFVPTLPPKASQNLAPPDDVALDCDLCRAGRSDGITAIMRVSAQACCSSLVFASERALHLG